MQKKAIEPRLCGGTFFVLLREACISSSTDQDVLFSLVKIFDPSFEIRKPNSFKTNTSNFRRCYSKCQKYFGFDNDSQVWLFNDAFSNNYDSLLLQMNQIIDEYIKDSRLLVWLVGALMELIESDSSISENAQFYIGSNGSSITKKEMLNTTKVNAAEFILGVWHFILTNRIDNELGQSTYNEWYTGDLTTAQTFVSEIGRKRSKDIVLASSDSFLFTDHSVEDADDDEDEEHPIPDAVYNYKDPYFITAYKEYYKLKTLLYKRKSYPFYSFFECNDVGEFDLYDEEFLDENAIHNCSISKLTRISRYIILEGTGGIGKSMMMRHLLLDSICNDFGSDQVPILMEVRNYKPHQEELDDYIYNEYLRMNGAMKKDAFSRKFKEGKLSLLFDGLDEINQQDFMGFCSNLNKLIITYPDNRYIISSRPFIRFIHLHRFITYAIYPLSKEQALSLIDKLEYKPNTPEIKESFRFEVDNALFASHTEFCHNPLLLTIMLLMYERFAHIPSRMHLFYQRAYLTLASHHDEIKGSFNRILSTGLDTDQFEEVFAEFCARSYHDECYSLTNAEMRYYYGELHSIKDNLASHNCSDFIHDVKDNLCLMYHDGCYYNFIHRSFQEYFCALYFSKKLDNELYEVGRYFDNRMDYSVSDNTFSMLCDIIPKRSERFIFFNYLDDLFTKCQHDYLLFLKEQYTEIFYWEGTIDEDDIQQVEAKSYIYREFCRIHGFTHKPIKNQLPAIKHFLINNYYYVEEDRWDDIDWIDRHRFTRSEFDDSRLKPQNPVIIAYSHIEPDYFEVYEKKPAGASYQLDISRILDEIEWDVVDYTSVINALEDDTFPLMEEYNAVYNYYINLKKKYDQTAPDQRALLFGD